MRDERGPWYLLTGLLLGLFGGLVVAWVVSPLQYVDTPPASLRSDFKDQYRAMIAMVYAKNGDIGRAVERLALLGEPDNYAVLVAQAQLAVALGEQPEQARALAVLAEGVEQERAHRQTATHSTPTQRVSTPTPLRLDTTTPSLTPSPTLAFTPTIAATSTLTPTIERTATPSRTPLPNQTATHTTTPSPSPSLTASPGPPFELQDRELACDPDDKGPAIQVIVEDAAGKQVPGVALVISWVDGEERFYTGLKPEMGLGYADFDMSVGVSYTLRTAEGESLVTDLVSEECATGTPPFWGVWRLTFSQP